MSSTYSNVTDEQIIQAFQQEGTKQKAADRLGMPRTTYRNRLDKLLSDKTDEETPAHLAEQAASVIYQDKRNPEKMSGNELLEAFIAAQGFRDKLSIRQFTCEVKVKADLPIALSFVSDVHIGSPHTDHQAFMEDKDLILSHPRHYMCPGGDWRDNMGGFFVQTTAQGQLHPAKIQMLTEEAILDEMHERIIAKIGGNHDMMDSKKSGVDTNFFMLRKKKFPYLPQGGLVKLTVGDTLYEILWKHRGRFNSALNQFNAHHRQQELHYPMADMVVMEHEHNPGIETIEKFQYGAERTVVNIRTGTYKIDDSFSMEFYKAGRIAPQTVILWPDKKKILAIHGRDAIRDAQTYLSGYEKK